MPRWPSLRRVYSLLDVQRRYVVRSWYLLVMQLAEQGSQQVTRNIHSNFLLKMANALTQNAEAISDALATFQPASASAAGGGHLESACGKYFTARGACWARDERWRALLDSLLRYLLS